MTDRWGCARLAATLLAAPVLFGLATPASADPETDAEFLESLRVAGITYQGDPWQVIGAARAVCSLLVQHKPGPQVLAVLQQTNPGLTAERGSTFIGIAAHSYCPDQVGAGGAG